MNFYLYKRFFRLALLIVVALATGCCKPYCPDANDIHQIGFKNIPPDQLDSLLFRAFAKGNNFVSPIDSFIMYPSEINHNNNNNIAWVYPEKNIDIQKDWEIRLLSTNAKYKIADFGVSEEKCGCGFSIGKQSYYRLSSYSINGVNQGSEGELIIGN